MSLESVVYSVVQGLAARLTAARAAAIDTIATQVAALSARGTEERLARLDATISSRAPADTAVSKADWTETRASNLDTILARTLAGSVKSVQRGVATAAGTVSITQVNAAKALVFSNSKGSAGYVAARGTVSLTPFGGKTCCEISTLDTRPGPGSFPTYSGAITGGTTDLTVRVYSAVLASNGLSLTCDGPCEWQVVEFY